MATDILTPPPLPASRPEEERFVAPDISHVATENDQPVDNLFSERQMRLLVEPLYASWRHRTTGAGRAFVAMANVGLFTAAEPSPVVPDVLVSLDVTVPPAAGPRPKEHRSYFIWHYGKPPDVVVEIVSNAEGGETGRKLEQYARIGVAYSLVFDPEHHVQTEDLRAFVRRGTRYLPLAPGPLEGVGLGVQLWPGVFEDYEATWLRWTDEQGVLLETGTEQAAAERARADAASARAEAAEAENAALRTRLRALDDGRRG